MPTATKEPSVGSPLAGRGLGASKLAAYMERHLHPFNGWLA